MGKRGPKPLPTSLHIAHGTYREDRHGNPDEQPSLEPLKKVPTAPKCLGTVGRRKWREVGAKLISVGLLNPLGLDALEVYCRAWDEVARCDGVLRKGSRYITSESGFVASHPAVNERLKWLDVARRVWALFGMTPSDATSVKVERSKQAGVRARKRNA